MSRPIDVINFRIRIKAALVKAFGGACQLCGKEYPQSVFDFHHIDPTQKKFGLSQGTSTRAKSEYAEEAKKCLMVCANCHRLIEHEQANISHLKSSFDEDVYYQTLEELTSKKEKIEQIKEEKEKPSKEQLLQDLEESKGNFTAVAKKYNYSRNAVVKWCKKFNLPFHSSDYK